MTSALDQWIYIGRNPTSSHLNAVQWWLTSDARRVLDHPATDADAFARVLDAKFPDVVAWVQDFMQTHTDEITKLRANFDHISRFYDHPDRGEMRKQKFPLELIRKNANLKTMEERYTEAMRILGLSQLSDPQKHAIKEVHELWWNIEIFSNNKSLWAQKLRRLTRGGVFAMGQALDLCDAGVCGAGEWLKKIFKSLGWWLKKTMKWISGINIAMYGTAWFVLPQLEKIGQNYDLWFYIVFLIAYGFRFGKVWVGWAGKTEAEALEINDELNIGLTTWLLLSSASLIDKSVYSYYYEYVSQVMWYIWEVHSVANVAHIAIILYLATQWDKIVTKSRQDLNR